VDVFVARQPIFDLRGHVSGYELLYRRSAQSGYADGVSTGQMSRDVVIQTFLEVGLDKITQGKCGYINFAREMLLEGAYELLDPSLVVIELLEDVPADAEVMEACQKLVAGGYQLALDDFVLGAGQDKLLPLAAIIKVDVLNRSPDEIRDAVTPLRRPGVRLLAEKVETAEVHRVCEALGFELFQGFFYSRPEIVGNPGVSVEQTTMIQLMNLLGSDKVSDQEVEEGFRRDASMSYKLLRMLGSAAHGGARGIDSIRYAIRLLGRKTLQRWLSLMFASSFGGGGGTDVELVHTAVLRARFAELLGSRAGRRASADALFLVGLFSLMDSLLRAPMEEVLARVDLAEPVRKALVDRTGPHAEVLKLVEAYEAGDWAGVTEFAPKVGVPTVQVPGIYLEALNWSREQLVRAK
jgi:c-di-GMP phosphodiesterase